MKHMRRYLALLTLTAIFLLSATPVYALFGKKEELPAGDPGAPIAQSMEVETYQGIPCTGTLTAVDNEGDAFTFALAAEPKKGTVTLGEDGVSFVYTPLEKKSGGDSFTFTATDAAGNTSAPATVSITISKQKTAVSYCDMEGRSAYPAAICLAENGIYVGRQVGSTYFFDPDAELTRSEFLAMAMDVAGVEAMEDVELTGFADDGAIPTWAKGYASAAVREGIVNGVSTAEGVSFCGEDAITLSEAASVMNRLLDVTDVEVGDLSQVRESWAAQAVANMESVSVVSAGSFGSESLSEPITRAEAAEMLAASLHLIESREDDGGLFGWLK